MSASVSRPLPRSPWRAPVNRSDRDSNTGSSLTGFGYRLRRRGRRQHRVQVALQFLAGSRRGRDPRAAQRPDASAGTPMQNASTTDEPSVVTFAHAMSTPSLSKTAVSLASRPARSVVRICTTNSSGEVPSNQRIRGGAGTGLIGTPGGISPARVAPCCAASRSRRCSDAMTSSSPSRARMNCWRSNSAAGGEPKCGDTTNVLMAEPS